ncbi:hypothetical protein [Gluconacetobacter takamatsuzukensis]|uniref:Uncharacterized protein n=1 Tax=Gluconacetobacter takamatsuzukensis TaxID=1286190 RepID=A0A7W4KFE9_9PROT|nr:hypothetical protein [Gluconacetobacter takamatsuzukensis]MBB2205962.1 hypothetical protein [Gluconacetobacter takamatsuzukensis]
MKSGRLLACAAVLCLTGAFSTARAADAGWSAPACGKEPAAPAVDSSSVAKYNASVDAVTAYEKAARTYNACVTTAAAREQAAISAQAKARIDQVQQGSVAVQQRISGHFTKLTADLKAGAARFSHP